MSANVFQAVNSGKSWNVARAAVWTATVALGLALWWWPSLALPVFWGLAVPALPAVFMLAPGLWRNVCPLATSNQLPRRLGWSREREIPASLQGAVFPVGVGLFLVLVSARKMIFNQSGSATALLLGGAVLAAFLGGLWFKGKSGWCSSICPVLPVQRLYGQAPVVAVANSHCQPCVGCAKNCLDQDPGKAQLSDQYDASRPYRNFRRFFAAIFPGFVLGFFLVPGAREIGVLAMLGQMSVYCMVSLTAFHLLDACFATLRNSLPLAFAAIAFNAYYWFSAPIVVQTLAGFGLALPGETAAVLRTALLLTSLHWAVRADRAERAFLRETREQVKQGQVLAVPVMVETLQSHREHLQVDGVRTDAVRTAVVRMPASVAAGEPAAGSPPRTDVSDTQDTPTLTVSVKRGQTLLEALEASEQPIDSGCRMGLCGADPVRIVDGAAALCNIGETEATTLARLQCPEGTRLACMARAVRAQTVVASVGLDSVGAGGAGVSSAGGACADVNGGETAGDMPAPSAGPTGDPAIRTVIIIGNGVAGVTAAATVRRLHAQCRVLLLGRESHPAYNRMAIARLLNDADALPSLLLHKPAWYTQQRIEARLDAEVVALDTQTKSLTLADGEQLSWDRLIIATGAPAWTPPIEGFDGPGAFVVRQADDVLSLRAFLRSQQARRVTVVGAGLLGIEVAQALRKFGVQVTVVSNSAAVLDRQADPMSSTLIVRHLKEKGIDIARHAPIRQVVRAADRHIMAVQTGQGMEIPTDALVCCTGTKPQTELFAAAGLVVRQGVVVDSSMRTSIADVFAAGDIAEFQGQRPGLWATAVAQAEVAAANACGEAVVYQARAPMTQLKSIGIDFRSFGRVQRQQDDDIELVDLQVGAAQYRKLLVSQGKVVGAILVNHADQAERFAKMVDRRIDATPWLERAGRGDWVRLELRPLTEGDGRPADEAPLSRMESAPAPRIELAKASREPEPPIELTRADDIARLTPMTAPKRNIHLV